VHHVVHLQPAPIGQAFPRLELGLAHHDVQRRGVAHGAAETVVVASHILEQRGNSPRQFRVMLVFVASDAEAMEGPDLEVHHYLAWKSIVEEQEILNLDAHHRRQAQDSMTRSNETVDLRLREVYSWLLVPAQEAGGAGTCATRVWAFAASRSSHQMSREAVRWCRGSTR
jgi:hypothetical protein